MSIAIAKKIRLKCHELIYFTGMAGKVFNLGSQNYEIISYDEAYSVNPEYVEQKFRIMKEGGDHFIFYYMSQRQGRYRISSFYKTKERTWHEQLVEHDGFKLL